MVAPVTTFRQGVSMRRVVLLGLVLVVALGASVASSTAAATETGVTARSVKIGGTFPLTGPASLYAPIPTAMKAYFSYINKRKGPDGKRGVYGRQINYIVYDDGYNPANSVQATRRLVEQDKIFIDLGSLGTEVNEAIRPYLNQKKVPQVIVATGATTWGADFKRWPWTGGWQPPYQFEGALYGQAIARNSPNAKIAVLYQNDSYGKDYITGLETGLGAKKSNIVAKEAHETTATSVASQMVRLKASGATILVIFSLPGNTIRAYATATALRWTPDVVYTNSVSATDTFLTAAKAGGASDAILNNSYTTQYLKDPANPKWDNDAGMKLYKQVMADYHPKGRVTDGLNFYGMAAGQAFVQLLYKAGKNPTRTSFMNAFRNWNEVNPFLLPGNKQKTGGNDQFPVGCDQLVKWTNGTFRAVSALKCMSGAGLS
jgi:branched-chain amino acid transport system substrate-binding protein